MNEYAAGQAQHSGSLKLTSLKGEVLALTERHPHLDDVSEILKEERTLTEHGVLSGLQLLSECDDVYAYKAAKVIRHDMEDVLESLAERPLGATESADDVRDLCCSLLEEQVCTCVWAGRAGHPGRSEPLAKVGSLLHSLSVCACVQPDSQLPHRPGPPVRAGGCNSQGRCQRRTAGADVC